MQGAAATSLQAENEVDSVFPGMSSQVLLETWLWPPGWWRILLKFFREQQLAGGGGCKLPRACAPVPLPPEAVHRLCQESKKEPGSPEAKPLPLTVSRQRPLLASFPLHGRMFTGSSSSITTQAKEGIRRRKIIN
jgi:hypothetical protein